MIHESTRIHADPATDWDLAGDPARIAEWLSAPANSSGDGDRRLCTRQDGGDLEERILQRSDQERFYEYEILEAPMLVCLHRSRLSVQAPDGDSHVDGEAEFEAPGVRVETGADGDVLGLYREGLESLRERLESAEAA